MRPATSQSGDATTRTGDDPSGRLRVAVASPRPDRRDGLDDTLRAAGFAVESAGSAGPARGPRPLGAAVLIVDAAGGRRSAVEALRHLRAERTSPLVLVVLTDGDALTRAVVLEEGADDCLVEPFPGPELAARVRALGRRAAAPPPVLRLHDLELDRAARRVTRAGRPLRLGAVEHDLLEALMREPRIVVPHRRLATAAWGHEAVSHDLLAAHVSRLRRKLEEDGAARVLHTVWGVGYVVRPPRASASLG